MPLQPGTTLGSYSVTAKIGEGGMGEVYQARDTKLDRDVALKVLPEAFTSDPDRLARFEREAKVLASLNHPNIGSIYGLEEAEGVRALVLELIEGPTLADRIAQGPIPLDEALPIAKQIAEALEAAHEQGVIHRDLKPANIKVKADGTVKVLDFGLAKAFQPEASDASASLSPTISLTAAATQMGMVIGTAAYMAPEQAKGKVVDKRADVWAFGAVLYEMLTGTRPFVGDDVSDTLAAVLRADVDLAALPDDTPATLSRVISACLRRDPKQRVHDVADVRLAMEGAFETGVSAAALPSPGPQLRVWQRPIPLALVGLALLALGGLAVGTVMRPGQPSPGSLARFVINTPPDAPLFRGISSPEVAISPDGTRIVYGSGTGPGSTRQLYLRHVDQLDATPLRGTEGGSGPFFSPDGEWVGFHAGDTLKKVSVLGGPAVTICDLDGFPRGRSWTSDDTIVFATTASNGLMRVPVVGGEPEVLTSVDPEGAETAHIWPEVLPNGKGVLFTAWSGSDDGSRIAVVSLETGEITYLVPGGSNPHYSPTGHIVYGVGGTLWAVGFDAERLALTSNNPVPVVENVNTKPTGAANFSLSGNGSLVYVAGAAGAVRAPQRTLVWVDREGREEPIGLPPNAYTYARLSPDGTRLAVRIGDLENVDVWISELARGTLTRLTTDPARDSNPLWTPDGERVVFTSDREGQIGLLWRAFDGTGDEVERLITIEGAQFLDARGWSPDGDTLVFWYRTSSTFADVGILSLAEERTWEPLVQTEAVEAFPAISPDGGWIAYASDETGQLEVYVQRFPELGQRRQISTGGGSQPRWSPDGRELFYASGNTLMVVPIETEPTVRAGTPETVFEGAEPLSAFNVQTSSSDSARDGLGFQDISPDGQRFLIIREGAQTDDSSVPLAQITVVLNWTQELLERVPID